MGFPQKQKRVPNREPFSKEGGDILSHRIAVPSAQAGLTSLFGMGRGEPRRNNHLGLFLAVFGRVRTLLRLYGNILAYWDKIPFIFLLESRSPPRRAETMRISLRVISTARL